MAISRLKLTVASIVFFTTAAIIICSSFGIKQPKEQATSNDSLYAGADACQKCHREIYESFLKTAHHFTSTPASAGNVKGNFEKGKNEFRYNDFMHVEMQKKNGLLFETAYINGQSFQSEPIDIAIGSARKGQTFFYWKEDQLFQLPVSYYTPNHSWCNSPGYPIGLVRFDRVIRANCLECHASYAKFEELNKTTYFQKNSIVYGIDCERCHGPAAKHVRFHQQNPKETVAYFVNSRNTLSRQQKLDICALCHGGARQLIKPPFSFTAGDKLTDFSLPNYNEDSSSLLDVHGNQYGLLTASKCFKQSEMNCASCHNVHKEEINVPKLYSSRCMNCHNDASHNVCTLPETKNRMLSDNCVDCHMPLLPSQKIFLQSADPAKSSPDFVRTHRVAIYPEITKQILAQKK